MAFVIRETVEKKKRAPAKPVPPIFERAKAQAIQQLDNPNYADKKEMGSLQQAIFRYVEGPARATAFASYNWKLPQGAKSKIPSKDNPKGIAKDEQVEVRIKAGGVAVKCLKDQKTGKMGSMMLVDSGNLVPVLQDMLTHLKGMSKDSDTGAAFHKVAIRTAKPKFKKGQENPIAYNPKTDKWETFSKGETKSEKKAEQQSFLQRNKEAREHWANKGV